MNITEWEAAMAALETTARYFADCDVMDIGFTSGFELEVYVAVDESQRRRGLASVDRLDLDLGGMLFVFETPTVTPFTAEKMVMDMDIAWYDRTGRQIQTEQVKAGHAERLICTFPFSYVLETPAGQLPGGNLVISGADSVSTMPDGSYPIGNAKQLQAAIHLVGRSKTYSTAQVKAHIIAAAKKLGLTNLLPPEWTKNG